MSTQHGGKRPGAGRPRVLSRLQRLMVGAECENWWKAEEKETTHKKIIEKTGAYHKRIDEIPLKTRRGRIAKQSIEEASADIDAALKPLVIGSAAPPDLILFALRDRTVLGKRPSGKKAEVIEAGRTFCRDRYRIAITARLAKTCWGEYRQWLAKQPHRS